jgi:plastocyanin
MGTTVDMKNIAFAPNVIHVTAGQTVTWTNSDPLQHTVTADDGSFDSGLVDPNGFFTQEFDTPGVVQYYCQPHGGPGLQGMSGTVIVDPPSGGDTGDNPDSGGGSGG